jgi:hypothetical protein
MYFLNNLDFQKISEINKRLCRSVLHVAAVGLDGQVIMNFIFNDNVRILCLSCNVGKLVRFRQKGQKKRHYSPFINFVKGVFFVVRVTLVPVSYLSAPYAVHSCRVPGKFIRRLKSLFV